MSSPADELHALLDERDAEIARLRAALEFYANEDNYDADGAVVDFVVDEEWREEDMGKKARAALAGQGEKP